MIKYIIWWINDEQTFEGTNGHVTVFFYNLSFFFQVIGARDEEYEQFLTNLQAGGAGECRYGLYDFEYTHQCQGTSEASKKQKLFLMSWCPDTAKVKKKMLYSRWE